MDQETVARVSRVGHQFEKLRAGERKTTMSLEHLKTRPRAHAAYQLRAKGLTYKQVGQQLQRADGQPGGVTVERARQLIMTAERLLRIPEGKILRSS